MLIGERRNKCFYCEEIFLYVFKFKIFYELKGIVRRMYLFSNF